LWGILLQYFIQKKSAAETHRIFVETYGNHARKQHAEIGLEKRSKNNDFDIEDKKRSDAKKFEDEELEVLFHEGSCQTLAELAKSLGVDHTTVSKQFESIGMIQKQEH